VDSFGGTSLAWASMGLEAHGWIPTAHMLDERDETLEA
jgi:hypothetical protein